MTIKVIASGSSGNATLISDGDTALLLDAGISIKELERGSGFTLSRVTACLVIKEYDKLQTKENPRLPLLEI